MRNDSYMNPGRLHLIPKEPYEFGIDHTSTMIWKREQMDAGIHLPREVRYVPAHRRAARGIVAGIIGGTAIWAVLLLIAWAAWRWMVRG
jgi:hypothetical protein